MNIISNVMRTYIPNIKKSQKTEVIDYLYDMTTNKSEAEPRYIAFNNGIYDVITEQLLPFSPEMIVTNKIPWDYNPQAYNELADNTLNKLACNDAPIRSLLEECIGYCFYRANTFNKAFILTGDKSNGKSTFLKVLISILGEENISSLDLKNLGDRFSKASLHGKLANIGDDISDEFIPDASLFKKITDGGRIQAERKGQDPFEFNPYVKLLFSANNMPRIKDKTGAVLRRLVIIPFNAQFKESDADYNPNIKNELIELSSIQYLIRLGCIGLKRIIAANRFTQSEKVQKEIDEYEDYNNPVLGFIRELDEHEILHHEPKEVFVRYDLYCRDNGFISMTQAELTKAINRELGTEAVPRKIPDGKGGKRSVRLFIKKV